MPSAVVIDLHYYNLDSISICVISVNVDSIVILGHQQILVLS